MTTEKIEIKDQDRIFGKNFGVAFMASLESSRASNTRKNLERISQKLTIETELEEESGRWIAEVMELPGVLVYGQTEKEAVTKAKVLALQLLADRLEHGESVPGVDKLFHHKTAEKNSNL